MNKGLLAILLASVVLAAIYVSNVRMLLYDNWIVYGFARSIDSYGLDSLSEISVYHRFYITYYPVPLWISSKLLIVDPTIIDLALFFVLFPLMILLTHNLVNLLSEKKASSFATFLFFFGGGSAWIARLLYTEDFWTASYLSLDANFGDNWLVTGLWAYKAFSLLLALASALIFVKLQWFNESMSSLRSTLANISFLLCTSLSILTYAYGILLLVGFIAIASLYVPFLKERTRQEKPSIKALARCIVAASIITLTVMIVDAYWANSLGRFIEERLVRFFGLNLNAYLSIFLTIFGGLAISILLNKIGLIMASHFRNRVASLPISNERRSVYRLSVATAILAMSCVVIAGIVLWLVSPAPEEYLLPATVWPLKYTISRYSFLYITALFTIFVAYRRGHTDIAFANLLSIGLIIVFGTLLPLPVKRRIIVPLKFALVLSIGCGISRILSTSKEEVDHHRNKRIKRVFAGLRRNAVPASLGILLVLSTLSSWYFWCNVVQEAYPAYEVEVSDWILENTPKDMHTRFLATSEWLTIKSIEMLAARPNIAPIESNDLGKVIDLLLENVRQYGIVYTVVCKSSEHGARLDHSLALLESCDLLVSEYENHAYKVYATTEKFQGILTLAENFENPAQAISSSHLAFYESFDHGNASGIYNNAVYVNDTAIIIETNSTLNGGFSMSLWTKAETTGEILYLEFDSGYLRARTNNPESISFIIYHECVEKPLFTMLRTNHSGWVQLFFQANGSNLNVYQNGTLSLNVEDERVDLLTKGRIDRVRISDKMWWDRGFQGFADELFLFDSTILYEDIMTLYISYVSRIGVG